MIRNNIRLFASLSILLIVLMLASFYLLYAIPASIAISKELGLIGSASPSVGISRSLPLANVSVDHLVIDGTNTDKFALFMVNGSYQLKLLEKIPDGSHLIKISGEIGSIIPLKWMAVRKFTIDTEAPQIGLFDYEGIIAMRPGSVKTLRGTSEGGATVYYSIEGRGMLPAEIDDRGHFGIEIGSVTSGDITISATDNAGNRTQKKYSLVVDSIPPQIKPVNFTPNKSYFDPEMVPAIGVNDQNSKLKFSMIEVNNGRKIALDSLLNDLSDSPALIRGKNTIKVYSYDIAGNTSTASYDLDLYRSRIVIDRSKRTLSYYEGTQLVRSYRISIGAEGYSTPSGTWRVVRKKKNPTWYNPQREWSKDMPPFIGPGPGNPLGTRALYLNAPGIRIHGTYNSGSIGRAASHGCIRMLIPDIEDLYERIPVGTPTRIL